MWRRNSDNSCYDDGSSTYRMNQEVLFSYPCLQDVFIIPDGGAGALAELERRKFTAEEGVRGSCLSIRQSLLTFFIGSSHPA